MDTQGTFVPNKIHVPWLTMVLIGICSAIYIAISVLARSSDWHDYNLLGMFNIADVRAGNYLGLITNNFVHIEWWHILMNMYALWLFGSRIEQEDGRPFMIFLVLSSSLIISAAEIIVGDNIGIGFSGILFAMSGYTWVQGTVGGRENYRMEAGFIGQSIAWLLLCAVLTAFNIIAISNAAHVGGLIYGCALAFAMVRRDVFLTVGVVLCCAITMVPVFWAPWSASAMLQKAYVLHDAHQWKEAKTAYEKVLERYPDNALADENLVSVKRFLLAIPAYNAHEAGNLLLADSLYHEILKLVPDDEFALENLKLLEVARLSEDASNANAVNDTLLTDSLYNEILKRDPENELAKKHKAMLGK